MARGNRTKFTILGVLTHGPRSGYDIKKFIEGSVDNFWRESYGQIYPTLRQLAKDGLVTKTTEATQGRPNRLVYAITDMGRQALRTWLGEPADPPIPRLELLLKLFFGAEVAPEVSLAHVRRRRELARHQVERLRSVEARLNETQADSPHLPFWLMTVGQGIRVCEALLDWCQEAESTLRSLSGDDHADSGGSGEPAD
jgi:DNA-binding PadR family transcriptional regulator